MLVLGSTVSAVVCLTLASTPVFSSANRAGRWVLYYLTGFCQASNSMFWAWTQETLSGDPATRAFASAGLNVWASVSHAVMPLALFQTVDQPAVVAGNYGAAGFAILHSLTSFTLAYMQHRRGYMGMRMTEETDVVENEGGSADDLSREGHDKLIQPHQTAVGDNASGEGSSSGNR